MAEGILSASAEGAKTADDDLKRKADKIAIEAAAVVAGTSKRRRTACEDIEIQLVPNLAPFYCGKIKPPTQTAAIKAELVARSITGWQHKNDGGEHSTKDLRALLPVDRDGYLTTAPLTNFEPDLEELESIGYSDIEPSSSDDDEGGDE